MISLHVSLALIIIVVAVGLCAVGAIVLLVRRARQQRRLARFSARWLDVQKLCASSADWPEAVRASDILLAAVLKYRRFKGRTMGERLVAAQRSLSDNDAVWFAHKLANKLEQATDEAPVKLQKRQVQAALKGVQQALKDLKILE